MFCCLRTCLNGGQLRKPTAAAHRLREPEVHLDAAHMGKLIHYIQGIHMCFDNTLNL